MEGFLHMEGNITTIRGATKVVSSTQNQAVIEVGERCLIFSGNNIEVKKLNLEEEEVCLEGVFENIKFTSTGLKKGGLLKRIFK